MFHTPSPAASFDVGGGSVHSRPDMPQEETSSKPLYLLPYLTAAIRGLPIFSFNCVVVALSLKLNMGCQVWN